MSSCTEENPVHQPEQYCPTPLPPKYRSPMNAAPPTHQSLSEAPRPPSLPPPTSPPHQRLPLSSPTAHPNQPSSPTLPLPAWLDFLQLRHISHRCVDLSFEVGHSKGYSMSVLMDHLKYWSVEERQPMEQLSWYHTRATASSSERTSSTLACESSECWRAQ